MHKTMMTTYDEPLTEEESALLAVLVYRQCGRDPERAARAWRRLLQHKATRAEYMALVAHALETWPVFCDVGPASRIRIT